MCSRVELAWGCARSRNRTQDRNLTYSFLSHQRPVGLAQFGVKKASVLNASLCDSAARTNGSIAFAFDHQEAGRSMHGIRATGMVWPLTARLCHCICGADRAGAAAVRLAVQLSLALKAAG